MRLTYLSLENFRNFARLDLDVPGGATVFLGSNAQGKTSLLEAVFYLAAFESFHAAHDRELVNFLSARDPLTVGRIVAEYQSEILTPGRKKNNRLEIRLILENKTGNAGGQNGAPRLRKEILVDGVKRKIGEAYGHFNAVLFLPQMLNVIDGSPDDRRRYLNLALSQVNPAYAQALQEYNQIVTQRNALLKALFERGVSASTASGELDYWDERLCFYGAKIIYERIQTIHDLERVATRIHHELTRGQEVLRLDYCPSYEPLPQQTNQFLLGLETPADRSHLSQEKIQAGFAQELAGLRKEEISRGMTTIGPHRDELRFLSNGIDLGSYGSRGQVRTTMLSMKLAEVDWMEQKTGQVPVLLLDEVLAELDPDRRFDLQERISSREQVLMTTTDLDLFSRTFLSKARLWRVDSGRIEEHFIPDLDNTIVEDTGINS
jgi:DNA replication and repair protein RecF